MIDGGWITALFVLSAIGVVVFVYIQNRNMNKIDIYSVKMEGQLNAREERVRKCVSDISEHIEQGALAFVKREMLYLATYIISFSIIVFMLTGARGRKDLLPPPNGGNPIVDFATDWTFGAFSTIAFICGAGTSAGAGYIGIAAATAANGRVAHKIQDRDSDRGTGREGIQGGFETCLRGGAVMAFGMFTVGVVNLFVLTSLYLIHYNTCDNPLDCNMKAVSYCLASYALGASSISILHRIGGSIYMKAVDLCRLILTNDSSPLSPDLPEFDARNPATIADSVGDVIGDVAGAGADLFGSFSQAICATLAIMASAINTLEMDGFTPVISHWSVMCLPLVIFQSGILVSMVLYLLTVSKYSCFNPLINAKPAESEGPADLQFNAPKKDYIKNNLERALWHQVVGAALVQSVLMIVICIAMLPEEFYVDFWSHEGTRDRSSLVVTNWQMGLCTVIGTITGLIGGYIGLYFTSEGSENACIERGGPVRDVYDACQDFQSGSSENGNNAALVLTTGMSLGQKSTVVTVLNLATGIYIAHMLGYGLGVAFAAMGSLGTVCSILITTTFGPIAKNAHAIAEMSGMEEGPRKAAGQLAAAGSNVLAMSKGFSTTVAALCAFAMVEAFMLRADVQRSNISIFQPLCMTSLLVGAMLPYYLSAMVVHATTKAAHELKLTIQLEFLHNGMRIMDGSRPNYKQCISQATAASLWYLTPIALLFILTPLSVGLLFGRAAVVGLVIGCILTAVPHSVSCANSGGIWSMTRQLLEANAQGPGQGLDEAKAKLAKYQNQMERATNADEKRTLQKYIEDCQQHVNQCKPQPSYEAALVGEHVADPLKDAVAPAVAVLMKELAIVALVMGPYFASIRGGYGTLGCDMSHSCDAEQYPMEGFDYLILVIYGGLASLLLVIWMVRACFPTKRDLARNFPSPMLHEAENEQLIQATQAEQSGYDAVEDK